MNRSNENAPGGVQRVGVQIEGLGCLLDDSQYNTITHENYNPRNHSTTPSKIRYTSNTMKMTKNLMTWSSFCSSRLGIRNKRGFLSFWYFSYYSLEIRPLGADFRFQDCSQVRQYVLIGGKDGRKQHDAHDGTR